MKGEGDDLHPQHTHARARARARTHTHTHLAATFEINHILGLLLPHFRDVHRPQFDVLGERQALERVISSSSICF